MSSTPGRSVAVLVVALLTLSAVSAASGGPSMGAPTAADRSPESQTRSVDTRERFASDAVAKRSLSAPPESVEVRQTASGGYASAVGTEAVAGAPRNVTMIQRFALTPDDPGRVRVTHVFRVPASVTSVETRAPPDVTAVETTGFTAADSGGYKLDSEATRATLSYTQAVNETVDKVGPEGYGGQFLFVDAGEWALFRRAQVQVTWSWRGGEPVGLERETATTGPGYTGDNLVYLGETTVTSRTAHGQTFRLVVPERASLAESSDAVLDALSDAADRLRVGDRDEEVNVFAAPTTAVRWGVRGLQFGDTDMWVRDAERLAVADNTWLHEYVHARQGYETAPSGRWLDEATASYYAALLAYETDRAPYEGFREYLWRGTIPPQSAAVMTDPATWANAANYWKGALVTGAIDRAIRLETDGKRSFGTVLSRLNEQTEPVDGETVLSLVESVSGPAAGDVAARYATTRAVPSVWTQTDHATAFGETPAKFTYRFGRSADGAGGAHPGPFAVSGPYRNGTVTGSPLVLYTGETLTGAATVTNAGGASASYEQQFTVGERVRETVSGQLGPGATATHGFSHAFRSTGERTVTFGSDRVAVRVYEPATADIANASVDPQSLDAPGTVAVSATVVNEHGAPARRQVNVTRDGERVATRDIALGPREERTVTVVVDLAENGDRRIGVGGFRTLTVPVGSSGDAGPGGGGSGDGGDGGGGSFGAGPGFGPAATLLGLLGGALLARKRRS
jgi:hypothetical protein